MGLEAFFGRTPVTVEEIKTRVTHALKRHPLCRNVEFEIVGTPRSARGCNWTVSLRSIEPRAVWEASEIVVDIQDAYELCAA